jgi:sugar/nucleoside kinase (ribokinase family)
MAVRPSGVLCCGNAVYDLLVRPVERLRWNTTSCVDSIEQHMGGNGANTAYTLARLGVPVRLITALGEDRFGEELRARLAGAGVDLAFAARMDAPTAMTVALVNAAGDRAFLHRPGASAAAFADPIEFTPLLIGGMSHLHLGNPFGLPAMRRNASEIARRAGAAGLSVSIDTGWDWQERWIEDIGGCLPHTDLLFVNEEEARRLADVPDAYAACRRLRELGARVVVVKLGAAGCAVFTSGGELRVPGFEVPVVDTTGAGDCFAGGFLAALHRGRTLDEAGRFGNAVAAFTIQHLGATAGLRSYEETEAWSRQREPGPPEAL